MHLFHWHFWTPKLEEMERFYRDRGFRVRQRLGREGGGWKNYGPPLDWSDFHGRKILFRIIEMAKDGVNVTFGQGKTDRFDHIGFSVTDRGREDIASRADRLGWKTEWNEKRTFLTTPWNFRIELMEAGLEQSPVTRVELRLPAVEDGPAQLAEVLGCRMLQEGNRMQIVGTDFTLSVENAKEVRLCRVEIGLAGGETGMDPVDVWLEPRGTGHEG